MKTTFKLYSLLVRPREITKDRLWIDNRLRLHIWNTKQSFKVVLEATISRLMACSHRPRRNPTQIWKRFQTRWLHWSMQNFSHCTNSDSNPYSLFPHRTGIRFCILIPNQTANCIATLYYVKLLMLSSTGMASESGSESESGSGNVNKTFKLHPPSAHIYRDFDSPIQASRSKIISSGQNFTCLDFYF